MPAVWHAEGKVLEGKMALSTSAAVQVRPTWAFAFHTRFKMLEGKMAPSTNAAVQVRHTWAFAFHTRFKNKTL